MPVFKVRQALSQLDLWKPTQRKSDRSGVTPLLFTQCGFDHCTDIKIIRMLWILTPGRQTHIISVGALWKPKQTLRIKQTLLHQMLKSPPTSSAYTSSLVGPLLSHSWGLHSSKTHSSITEACQRNTENLNTKIWWIAAKLLLSFVHLCCLNETGVSQLLSKMADFIHV